MEIIANPLIYNHLIIQKNNLSHLKITALTLLHLKNQLYY